MIRLKNKILGREPCAANAGRWLGAAEKLVARWLPVAKRDKSHIVRQLHESG
ncbi:hypothetical protein [Comamonas fluminis]|uniref:hypothetical protein n=1 Tax=Comamonas fluminis TaxID=2796366 RepID=UPI001C496965|nr:hypothetical protein [Comamonas fluminis]